jgi:pyrroline-5-carboxylate reductase
MNITFVGGGNMATALIGGLLQQGFAADAISVVEPSPEKREHLAAKYQVRALAELRDGIAGSAVIVLAVKPQQLKVVAAELAPQLSTQLVISIAAGIRSGDLSRWLGGHKILVRVMPNTPAMVMAGTSGLYALPDVNGVQRASAQRILEAVGSVIWLQDEQQMDAITAVSGSGPAYVFYFIEALEEAAIELGFNADQARRLSIDTFVGAAKLADLSEEDIRTLRARVTSKGGTTERALHAMESSGVKEHIISAIRAAAERSRELGDELGKAE